MSHTSSNTKKTPAAAPQISAIGTRHSRRGTPGSAILLAATCLLACSTGDAGAQTRSLPSHGKIKIDSYNFLMRDVHPASQAQANYLQNRLFTTGLKKSERLERQERLDTYSERKTIEIMTEHQTVMRRLAGGNAISARSLPTLWILA